MARTTINDVAKRAGVSVATVSRALRGLPNVSASTRRRVEAAAEALSYAADSRASSLASGRTNIIGLVAPDFGSWYVSQTVAGVEKALAAVGYDLLVLGVPRSPDREEVFAERLATRRLDGLLLVDFFVQSELRTLLLSDSDLPIVAMGETIDGLTSLTIDNVAGGRMMVEHLVELGHRDIVYLGGNPTGQKAAADVLRRVGASEAAEAAGHGPLRIQIVSYDITGGRDGWHELQASGLPTAVLCGSDEVAMGFMFAARRSGVEVPKDLSVVGFDDHEMAEALGLTTVRQRVRANGIRAVELLLAQIAEPDLPRENHVADLELVTRASSGPPN